MTQCEGLLQNGDQCPRLLGLHAGSYCRAHTDKQNKYRAFWTTAGALLIAAIGLLRKLKSGKT